jgi:hypothetical protein
MPLNRKATLILNMIAIVIIFVMVTAFIVAFSGNGSATLSGILDDWFSSVHAPQIGKPDIVAYGECPSIKIVDCGNARCRQGAPKVTVSNQGESDISKNLTFLIRVDPPGSAPTQLQEVSGLRIGQEKTYPFVSADKFGGNYKVSADCQDQVAELDESNNMVTLNCPAEYLLNCYTLSSTATSLNCPYYCNQYPSRAQIGRDCHGVNATAYPDKLITLTDCDTCPSDQEFEGGCFCPAYCNGSNWNQQTAPSTNCGGGRVPDLGPNPQGCTGTCRDTLLCSCDKPCDPETKGRIGYVPRGASCGMSTVNSMNVSQDCTTTCIADKSGRGCFCPTECDKAFALPGETCTAVKS